MDKDNVPVKDGSLDELLGSADMIYLDGNIVKKPVSKTSLVIETPAIGIPLKTRVFAHGNIIKSIEQLLI